MDLTSLYNQSDEIKNETADGLNSAKRVGSLFYSIVAALEEIFTTTANEFHAGLMSVATYNTTMMSVKRLNGVESELNKLANSRASATTDGLMSKETYNTLATQTQRISEIETHLLSEQTAVAGTNKNYVYSLGKSEDTKTLLSSKFWIYQHGDGNMFFRVKHWGAANDKEETDYSQVMIPNAWVGANGLLRRDVYSRLDSFALREENSTTTQVNIITPIFTTGGARTFSISRATSAKAGVMTAEMYDTLTNSASRLDQATFVMPESYLPSAVNDASIVVSQKADYIRMAKAILYGGYVCIRHTATQSDKIEGNYLVPVTEAQAKYTDDDNFRVRFVYNGNRYSVRCQSGTMSHYLEENYAPTIKAQIAALTARIEALEKKA
nr:MAG TPA: hypothetical protein [Caudoviricetes sp.]